MMCFTVIDLGMLTMAETHVVVIILSPGLSW